MCHGDARLEFRIELVDDASAEESVLILVLNASHEEAREAPQWNKGLQDSCDKPTAIVSHLKGTFNPLQHLQNFGAGTLQVVEKLGGGPEPLGEFRKLGP